MSIKRQLKHVEKFLHSWLVEGGPNDSVAPGRVVSLWGLTLNEESPAWELLQIIDNAVEDWAIELGVATTPVDDAHPDAPWGDNIVRKLMVIRGS